MPGLKDAAILFRIIEVLASLNHGRKEQGQDYAKNPPDKISGRAE